MNESPEAAVPSAPLRTGQVWAGEAGTGRFTHEVRAGRHVWIADEPTSVGGDDAGPGPFEMLLAALAACISMTLRMYADRKEWPVERIGVVAFRERVSIEPDDDSGIPVRVDQITCEVDIVGDLTIEQRERLRQIADRCPVHRTLEGGIRMVTRLTEPTN